MLASLRLSEISVQPSPGGESSRGGSGAAEQRNRRDDTGTANNHNEVELLGVSQSLGTVVAPSRPISLTKRLPGEAHGKLNKPGEKTSTGNGISGGVELEPKELTRLQSLKSGSWRWPPEIDLVHGQLTGVQRPPIPVCDSNEDAHCRVSGENRMFRL